MSGRRSSVSDYPEHLNPFYDGSDKWHFWGKIKRSGSFSNSLKDLRNTITLRSFRGHKKPKYERDSDVQLRNHTFNGYSTVLRQTAPVVTSTPLLPRSRFSERVRKSVDHSYDSSKNPFENADDGDDNDVNEIKPEEYRKRVRRRKRRAPLPPGVKDSSWSLTSVETDISSYPHSEVSDLDVSEIEKPMAEICEMLQSFTKEIEKMTDSFNGNETHNSSKEHEDAADNCPKIVITSAECSPTKENILVIESVSYTTQEDGEGDRGDQQNVLESHNNDSRIAENVDHKITQEGPPLSNPDHEVIERKSPDQEKEVVEENVVQKHHEITSNKLPSLERDREVIEEKISSLGFEEKQSSSGCEEKTSSVSCEEKATSLNFEEKTSSVSCEEKATSLGCEENKSSSGYDHEIIVEEKPSSLDSDHKILVEEKSCPMDYDQKIVVEEKQSPLEYDHKIVDEEKPSPLGYDHNKVEKKSCLVGDDHNNVEEKPSSSGCDYKRVVEEEKSQNLDNNNYLNDRNPSGGLDVNHFSRYAHNMKYIDESYSIHDRVMDDSDIRNDNTEKIDETNNNKEYIPNGSYKENKFPVEESDFANNGNGTNINKNVIEQNEIQEQPPVPKVRKKKFTKAKLLGFLNRK